MTRKEFLNALAMIPFGTSVGLKNLEKITDNWSKTERMPLLFVGHGSPMNAIEENAFTENWKKLGSKLPKPKAILCISAHWETKGTKVTAMARPRTIHDFGGFPEALFKYEYNGLGSDWLVNEAKSSVAITNVEDDHNWGLDHGCWSVLAKLYPSANIPVIQMSLDYTKDTSHHYQIGQQLIGLREKGVLILASGNMIHNLRMMKINRSGNFNDPFGFDWALEMNEVIKDKIHSGDHKSLIDYKTLHKASQLAIPTVDHYLPLLYILSQQQKGDNVSIFNDQAVAGSITMTSVLIEG